MKKIVFLLIALCLCVSLFAVVTEPSRETSGETSPVSDALSSGIQTGALSSQSAYEPYPVPPIPNKEMEYEQFYTGLAVFTSDGIKRDLRWVPVAYMFTNYLGYTDFDKLNKMTQEEKDLYYAYGADIIWRLIYEPTGLTVDLLIFPTYSDAMEFYEYLMYEVEEQSYREEILVLTDHGRNWAYCRAERGVYGGGMCFGVAENTLLLARVDYNKGVSLGEADRIFTLAGVRESDVKHPLSEEGFLSMAQRAGLIHVASEQLDPRQNAGVTCMCGGTLPERVPGEDFAVYYYIFDSEASASAAFDEFVADTDREFQDRDTSLIEHTSGRNWEAARWEKLNQYRAYILIRVENTVLYILVDDMPAVEGDRIVAILGY